MRGWKRPAGCRGEKRQRARYICAWCMDRLTQGGTNSEESVQRRRVQVGWRLCDLDEMPQALEDLRGLCDDGEHLHGFATPRASQRIRLVDLLDQPSPVGTTLLGRYSAFELLLVGETEADARLEWMVALPALWREAEDVRGAGPGAKVVVVESRIDHSIPVLLHEKLLQGDGRAHEVRESASRALKNPQG
jgi:hypothetical protein